jgi:hypothetical protein
MNYEDTVEPQVQEQALEVAQEQLEAHVEQEVAQEIVQETKVPLSALQKERRKRQEHEAELQMERDQRQKSCQPDESQYEPVTKADLGAQTNDILRQVEEKSWIKNNPEKYQKLNENLENFLRQKPHLAEALKHAPNRWEEAWELMSALTPKQQTQLKTNPIKKEAPGSPSGIPKAAAMNQAVDVMSMSDAEFTSWRQSQKKRR